MGTNNITKWGNWREAIDGLSKVFEAEEHDERLPILLHLSFSACFKQLTVKVRIWVLALCFCMGLFRALNSFSPITLSLRQACIVVTTYVILNVTTHYIFIVEGRFN